MPVKSGMEGCDKKVLTRGQSPFLDPGSHGQIPRRSLNALTVRETAYLDHVARVIRRSS
jgi:hypothetical protein